jgi:hypothetical protein
MSFGCVASRVRSIALVFFLTHIEGATSVLRLFNDRRAVFAKKFGISHVLISFSRLARRFFHTSLGCFHLTESGVGFIEGILIRRF